MLSVAHCSASEPICSGVRNPLPSRVRSVDARADRFAPRRHAGGPLRSAAGRAGHLPQVLWIPQTQSSPDSILCRYRQGRLVKINKCIDASVHAPCGAKGRRRSVPSRSVEPDDLHYCRPPAARTPPSRMIGRLWIRRQAETSNPPRIRDGFETLHRSRVPAGASQRDLTGMCRDDWGGGHVMVSKLRVLAFLCDNLRSRS